MRAVRIGALALGFVERWSAVPDREVRFDGRPVLEGKATAFTNAAIESAVIHCRTLLEFIGLESGRDGKLRQVRGRLADDIGIEMFPPATKITVAHAVAAYTGPADHAEAALTYVVHVANKVLAHPTAGPVLAHDVEACCGLRLRACRRSSKGTSTACWASPPPTPN